jgi:UDP-N-acetylglucosamine 4,6-dehydratase
MNYLSLIGRDTELFVEDISSQRSLVQKIVAKSRVLVIGGAGSISQAVTEEIFKRDPKPMNPYGHLA